MTLVLFILGLFIRYAPLPEIEAEEESAEELAAISGKTNIFQFPHLILGAVTLFFYVGIEVIAGDTIIRYGMSLGLPIESAKYFTSLVLVAMVVGYIIGIALIPRFISQKNLLAVSAVSGLIFTVLAILIPASKGFTFPFIDLMTFQPVQLILPYTVLFIALLGISNAIVWPAVWPLAIHGLGKFIKTGSALLIMGIAGGALLPLLWGWMSDHWGAQNAYWIAVPCYLFILYFALYGHKLRNFR
jgi:fucose permease